MKILDWYILKRYLGTFFAMILMFIPIGIIVDLSEKIDNILEHEAPFGAVVSYYLDFTIYFANLLFPLFVFLSVIWFTSKLANKTEIIAFLSSGVSFWRFLRPYMIGAILICVGALAMGLFLAPKASQGFNEFKYTYLKKGKKVQETRNVYRQLNDSIFLYASDFKPLKKKATNFTLEYFDGNKLVTKISARTITFIEKDSIYELRDFVKRTVLEDRDIIEKARKKDTILPFDIDEFTPVTYVAETLNYMELSKFIEKESKRGSSDINRYKVVAYKRWSIPVSAFILTVIGVAVSSMKRRGGMGINLAVGISLAFVFIFFDKVLGTLANQSDFPPLVAVWFPNFSFGILAIYLLYNAKR
ncbi:LptF/LptG family permease [Aquimarina sp. MMG015]|uniref:LptF/LptG family permease n=1 Tax=Aquimarina TaxID=290174 RepID=UPI0004815572|nr:MULTISPECIES: LptF/LptG family permease [Aquimarina]AXT56008.1 YjgP/YjgQ family permease [Aquimarina sp. AD1]MBQ4803906.1 LptF/LptG family permease [Aquimarina sp. MMG015]RKN37324.1 YjgP/YjgQ family permease [Aquimarina sp. AD1]